jgi:(1->4)-alpha-D-glucan 1-alpha-D-glucosylmutase
MRELLALRQEFADLFTHGSYRPLDVIGPHRREIIAFARLCERNAIVVVSGRLFGRATQEGRRWPPSQAWNASVLVEGFSAMRNLLAAGKPLPGPRLPVADLFDVLPIALLQAQYTQVRRERSKAKVSAAAK